MGNEVVHCNSCGSYEIEIHPHSRLGKCKSCGANVILPDLENHEILALLDQAFIARASLKFADAFNIYSFIIQKSPDELAAYDGILLSKYGIIYEYSREEDRWVATSRVYNPKTIFDDKYFKYFIENCHNDDEKNAFVDRANEIDKLQKAYAAQLKNEKDYDVFISFKSKINGKSTEDALIARELYDELSDKLGLRVFMSDVTLKGRIVEEYEPIIYKALHSSKVFILVGTSKENVESSWVKNEWIRFLDRVNCREDVDRKSFIPVFKYMDPDDMPYPGNRPVQCVDASDLLYHKNISDYISELLGLKKVKDDEEEKKKKDKEAEEERAERQKEKEEYNKQMAAMKAAEESAKRAEEEARKIKESKQVEYVYTENGAKKKSYFDKGVGKSVTTGIFLTIFFWPAAIPYWINFGKYNKNKRNRNKVNYINKEEQKKPVSKKKKRVGIVIGSIFAFIFVIAMAVVGVQSCSSPTTEQFNSLLPTFTSTQNSDFTISFDHEYSFMPSEYDVYIAKAFSNDTLKIEHWHKSSSSDKEPTYKNDVGMYKINDSATGFKWVDNEKTAFAINFKDSSVSKIKNERLVIFTINNNNSNEFKGTNYSNDIACFTYTNDDYHIYRAIPLSDIFVKFECWYRSTSTSDPVYYYDYRLINTQSNDTDFSWNDNGTAFTLTCIDYQNNFYWKNEKMVGFEIESNDYKYKTVLEYLTGK